MATATLAPTRAATAAPTATTAPQATGWIPDGVVSPGEYAHEAKAGSVTLYWSNDAVNLYMAVQAKATGWVSVGFKPAARMEGADYVLGFVKGGQVQIHDAYGNAPTGSHPNDEDLGGANDLIAYGGAEANGVTTLEFSKPLNSGDQNDNVLAPGEVVPVIVAFSAGDSFTAPHSFRGAGSITLD